MDNKLTKSDIKKILKMTFKYDPETVNTYLQNPQNADEEYRNTLIKLNMKKNPLEFIDKVYDTYNLHMEGGLGREGLETYDECVKRRIENKGTLEVYDRKTIEDQCKIVSGAKGAIDGTVGRAVRAVDHSRQDRIQKANEGYAKCMEKANKLKWLASRTAARNKCSLNRGLYHVGKATGLNTVASGVGKVAGAAIGAAGTLGAVAADQTVGRVGRAAAAAAGMPTQATCNRCPKDWCNSEIEGNNRLFAPSSSSESRGRSSWTGFKLRRYPNQEDLQEHPDYQQGYYDALNEYPAGEEQYEEYPTREEQYEEYPAGQEQMQQMPMQSPYVYPINYQQQYYE